jgi:predicted transcriptional regulator
MDLNKKIKIQINCIKRLLKEEKHYCDEIENLNEMIATMLVEDPENYDVNKKKEILEETINTKKRTESMIKKYKEELKLIISDNLEEGNISRELIEEINMI